MNLMIKGGDKNQRKLAKKVVNYCLIPMNMSRLRRLNISMSIKKMNNCHGFCSEESNKRREYTIVIANNYNTIREFIETIAHEMAHVKQYICGGWNDEQEAEDDAEHWEKRIADDMWEKNLI